MTPEQYEIANDLYIEGNRNYNSAGRCKPPVSSESQIIGFFHDQVRSYFYAAINKYKEAYDFILDNQPNDEDLRLLLKVLINSSDSYMNLNNTTVANNQLEIAWKFFLGIKNKTFTEMAIEKSNNLDVFRHHVEQQSSTPWFVDGRTNASYAQTLQNHRSQDPVDQLASLASTTSISAQSHYASSSVIGLLGSRSHAGSGVIDSQSSEFVNNYRREL